MVAVVVCEKLVNCIKSHGDPQHPKYPKCLCKLAWLLYTVVSIFYALVRRGKIG